MRVPLPHPFPMCQVYLIGCGCGCTLGETLMEPWKRENAPGYKRWGAQEGQSREELGHGHTQILRDRHSIPTTLTPQH